MKKIKILIIAFVLCFTMAITIQSNNVDAKKADIIQKNKQKKITSITKYHNNNKVAYVEKNTYYANGKLNKKTIIKYATNGKKTYDYTRLGYSNGKAKQTTTHSNFINGNYKKREINKYRVNGKITNKEIITRNNSFIITDNSKFKYNKMGQLKSNKYGAASKEVYKYYSNNKVSSKTSYKYNAKGKLYAKVVNTKSYLKNKPIITFKNPTQAELNVIGNEIVKLVNNERTRLKLNTLKQDSKLTNAGNLRAKELKTLFSHTRPNGTLWTTINNNVNYNDNSKYMSGENIIYSYNVKFHVKKGNNYVLDAQKYAKYYFDLWKASPGHYANMINSSHNEIGVGIYYNNGYLSGVQLFGNYFQ